MLAILVIVCSSMRRPEITAFGCTDMRCRITIGIPTVGRAPILRETLREIGGQIRPADSIIVCATKPTDVEGAVDAAAGVRVVLHEAGLPRQRNAVAAAAADADIVVFFDDDFLPDSGYLAAIEDHMMKDRRIVVATGLVVADGIGGPGLSAAEGRAILQGAAKCDYRVTPAFSGYGCNMAVRLATMREH